MNKRQPKKRTEVDDASTWNTSDLYPTEKDWELENALLMDDILKLHRFQGKLKEGFSEFFEALKTWMEISEKTEKNYVYAYLKFHEDMTDPERQALTQKADRLVNRFETAASFIVPEIMQLPSLMLNTYISHGEMTPYHHFMENILREKEHVLSHQEEELLAGFKDISSSPSQIFAMINDADIKFADVVNQKGEKAHLTKGNYTSFLRNSDRTVRKSAYENMHDAYIANKNTLAQTYISCVKKNAFYAKTRKYPSAIAMSLSDDNIPLEVYDNLLKEVNKALPLLHRYLDIRKKALGLSELQMYDLYAPIVSGVDFKITWEEAKETVLKALTPLGDDYIQALKSGFDGGWIDVYENIGKRSGAYAWGCGTGHPYVLMNFDGTIDSLFTLAHEMGHAMHFYLTWKKQPHVYSGHKIFVAEVASTVNEVILMDYMLKTATDDKLRKYILNYYLEQFRGTFFRQTMFAEFEKNTHEIMEKGEPLTLQTISSLYRDLNEKWYKDVIKDNRIDIEWARIPHFYNAFYVYQYATGFSAAVTLSKGIINNHKDAVAKYLHFLESGSSDYSINLLKRAGADMTDETSVTTALSVFESLLDEIQS